MGEMNHFSHNFLEQREEHEASCGISVSSQFSLSRRRCEAFCGILCSAQFAWAKWRILCNLCHIITFHTIFFSKGKKHEAFCGCCQANQNAPLELVSHFMWAAKQDWAVTGCMFGSLVPGKKMQIHFYLAHSLNISQFGWMDPLWKYKENFMSRD